MEPKEPEEWADDGNPRWSQEVAAHDNDFDAELSITKDDGKTKVFGHSFWRLKSQGEMVMWGVGSIVVEFPTDREYVLEVGPRVPDYDDFDWKLYEPSADDETHGYVGWAEGRVHHKMEPMHSPDISAFFVDELPA